MKVISIGTGQKIFEAGSAVRQRQVEYGKIFEELYLVVFTPDKKEFKNETLSQNVFLYPTRSKIRIFFIFDYFRIVKEIIKIIGREKVVLSVQDPFETGLVGLFLKWRYKLSLQIQIHTDFANKYFILHSPLNFLRFIIGEITLGFADAVRVVSKKIAQSVHNNPQHVAVLPVFVEKFKDGKMKKSKDLNHKIQFLTVARLEKEKDLETLIKSFGEAGLNAQLTIVGDGSQRSKLENLTKNLNLTSKISFVGWQNDLTKFFEEADVYVSASLYEGYGMSLVEAALSSCALVLTPTGLVGDIFNAENSIICKQKDVEAFREAFQKLAGDKIFRESLAAKGGESARLSLFTHDLYLEKYKNAMALALTTQSKNIFKRNILMRYFVSGITGATSQIGSLYIFTDVFKIWYLYSSIFSFIIAIFISFSLQKFWTFADRGTHKMHYQFLRYVGVFAIGLILNTAFMYILVDIFKIWYILAQIITGGILMFFNFIMYKFFIFHKN